MWLFLCLKGGGALKIIEANSVGNWEEFRKLIDKIDKVYEEIA